MRRLRHFQLNGAPHFFHEISPQIPVLAIESDQCHRREAAPFRHRQGKSVNILVNVKSLTPVLFLGLNPSKCLPHRCSPFVEIPFFGNSCEVGTYFVTLPPPP